jgi:hypothetical protein
MNQELFIVFCERTHEPETQRVLAVFDTEELADKYIDIQRKIPTIKSLPSSG